MEIESTIRALQSIKQKLVTDDIDLIDAQIDLLERIISRFFDKSSYYHRLEQAKRSAKWVSQQGDGIMGHSIEEVKRMTNGVVDHMIFELENFGAPSKTDTEKKHSVTINNNNNNTNNVTQNQTLTTNTIKQVLQEELTGKQFNEVMQIIEAEPDPVVAAPKLLDKLKSFGSDVASNVLANILTNPNLYGTFLG